MASETTLTVITPAERTASFKRATARFIEKRLGYETGDVVDILDWDETADSGSGCETCGYGTSIELRITYKLGEWTQTFYYDGSFSEILTDILSMDDD